MDSQKETKTQKKKSKMDGLEFITLWNSEKSLSQIAAEKNVNIQSLKTRAAVMKREVMKHRDNLSNQLKELTANPNHDLSLAAKLNTQIDSLQKVMPRNRLANRKTGLDGLLELAKKV